MIRLEGIAELEGRLFPSKESKVIDVSHLTLIPSLIDPHVHLRTPGSTHKEDWEHGAKAAIATGVTCVFDMPNTLPPTTTYDRLQEKKKLIDEALERVKIPLKYFLYFGADEEHLDQIPLVRSSIIGLKIYMGHTTGNLLVDKLPLLERLFKLASDLELLISVHAEDESILQAKKSVFSPHSVCDHPTLRDRKAALIATEKALNLALKYKTRLNILHIGTKEEVQMISEAKKRSSHIFCETTPNHLFLNDQSYPVLGSLVQMNPPIRSSEDQQALLEGIHKGVIDTIGTDHAPHTLEEKQKPYPHSPSGIPGLDTLLPLLLHAVNHRQLTLPQIIELTHSNVIKVFQIPDIQDKVLVDLSLEKEVMRSTLKTKCGWSPYEGLILKGWPIYTLLDDLLFDCHTAKRL